MSERPPLLREFSAGGVLVRRLRGRWWVAAIRPNGKPEGTWALPKGLIDPGESGAGLIHVGQPQHVGDAAADVIE